MDSMVQWSTRRWIYKRWGWVIRNGLWGYACKRYNLTLAPFCCFFLLLVVNSYPTTIPFIYAFASMQPKKSVPTIHESKLWAKRSPCSSLKLCLLSICHRVKSQLGKSSWMPWRHWVSTTPVLPKLPWFALIFHIVHCMLVMIEP